MIFSSDKYSKGENMDIRSILESKPHNKHYLNRYIKFINYCSNKNLLNGEHHHICPRSKDLFPQFANLTEHKWNCVILTLRQHYVAHLLLWKSFSGKQGSAYYLMSNRLGKRNSRFYEKSRLGNRKLLNESNQNRLASKTHNFLTNNPSKGTSHHRTGAKHTESSRRKTSEKLLTFFKENKGSRSLRIHIFNEKNELQYECFGNFNTVCIQNNLPLYALRASYINQGKPIYTSYPPKIPGMDVYKGWYSVVIK